MVNEDITIIKPPDSETLKNHKSIDENYSESNSSKEAGVDSQNSSINLEQSISSSSNEIFNQNSTTKSTSNGLKANDVSNMIDRNCETVYKNDGVHIPAYYY